MIILYYSCSTNLVNLHKKLSLKSGQLACLSFDCKICRKERNFNFCQSYLDYENLDWFYVSDSLYYADTCNEL